MRESSYSGASRVANIPRGRIDGPGLGGEAKVMPKSAVSLEAPGKTRNVEYRLRHLTNATKMTAPSRTKARNAMMPTAHPGNADPELPRKTALTGLIDDVTEIETDRDTMPVVVEVADAIVVDMETMCQSWLQRLQQSPSQWRSHLQMTARLQVHG